MIILSGTPLIRSPAGHRTESGLIKRGGRIKGVAEIENTQVNVRRGST